MKERITKLGLVLLGLALFNSAFAQERRAADNITSQPKQNAPACNKAETILLNEGFENGIPATWLNVDQDGDGRMWVTQTTELEEPLKAHEGTGVVGSLSVYKGSDWVALTPDNWLITPDITGATKISFWVASQGNTQYDSETYGVYVSSTDRAIASFTSIHQENIHDQIGATWTERTLNIPAGTKYIAFRHFNSTDQYVMVLDDIKAVSGTTGLNNYAENNISVSIYPNPIVKNVEINAKELIRNVEIFDVLGKKVLSKEVKQNSTNIDFSNLEKGMYIIKLQTDKGIGNYKVVKN